MTSRSSLNASGYDVGDIKLRYAPNYNPVESSVISFRSQEWLRTGYLVPYAVKYAAHLQMGIGRGLYAYDAVLEQLVYNIGNAAKAQVSVDYTNGRYYFFPDEGGNFTIRSKAALDSGASSGTASTAMPGGVGITEMRGFFTIKSGANLGRVFVATNGVAGYKLLYNTGTLAAAWTDASLGIMTGGDPRVVIGKPDGSLIVVLTEIIASGYGAGNIKTSNNGGTVWASQTCNLATALAPQDGQWCPTLNKFIVTGQQAGVMRYFSTADGYNLTQETGVVPDNSSGNATCFIADNGAATIVLGAANTIYRSTGGGAFAAVATPRQLMAICSAGASLYALNINGGVELSTDNGTTWSVIGQINGPLPSALSTSNAQIKAANGNLFVSTSTGWIRFSAQALPGLTPDRVGAVTAVPIPSGMSSAAHYVRIL